MTPRRQPPIRVLHVIQNLNYGGMERLLADIVLRADPERFEMHVLCLQYLGRFAQGLEADATLHVAGPSSRYSMLFPRALARQIAAIDPDVVHTHSGVWYKTSLAARIAGVRRIVHTEHGRFHPDPTLNRVLDGLAARRSDVVVAVSVPLEEHLRRALRVNAGRLRVIHNGVDTRRFRPDTGASSVAEELQIPPGAPVIGSVGRLEPVKGYDVALEAFALLSKGIRRDPQPVLILAGEGSERPALERRARELGIADAVLITGWRDDVQDLHRAFSLFTLCSHSEGTSVSLLEAMSSGLCPIVTDVGGNAEVLGPDLRHRLVPAGDPAALAAAWGHALEAPAARRADADLARRRVVEHFDVTAMVRAYQEVYTNA